MGGFKTWGFDDFSDYVGSLKAAYRELGPRALSPQHPLEVEETPLPKTLNWFHVSCLGVGLIVGAGIFVSTGEAAAEIAGPAVVLSFVVAGISAILSTLCYSEFAVRFPLSGGAFNYLLFTCGEMAAFGCVCTLILEYVLANAAVARSFAPYFGQLIGRGSSYFVFEITEDLIVDPLGAGLVVACTLLVVYSTDTSSTTNMVITLLDVGVIIMIMIVGFTKADLSNMTPFVPPQFGIKGIFAGASFVFFSFIGFDCVSTMAEEVKNPARDMPVGIVSCITFVTILYVFMALSLVMMVPYMEIDPRAAFPAAFEAAGMPWMRVIVALGAILGIITGVLVGCISVARIFSAVGRAHLLFPVIGHIHPKYHTPAVSSLLLSVPTTLLALLSDLPMLVNLVSAGTLFVFGMVALALIIKRYSLPPDMAAEAGPARRALRTALIIALVLSASALGVVYNVVDHYYAVVAVIAVHVSFTIALHALVLQAPAPEYTAPLFPYVPSASLAVNAWLCSTLPGSAWVHYAVFLAIVAVVYFGYSCASSLALEEHSALRRGGGAPPSDLVRVISQSADSKGLVELAPVRAGGGAGGLQGAKAADLA